MTESICSKCGSVFFKEEPSEEGSEYLCIQCKISLAEELIEEKYTESIQASLTNRYGKKTKRKTALLVGLITSIAIIATMVPILLSTLDDDNSVSLPVFDNTDDLTMLQGEWTTVDGILSPDGKEKHQVVFGDQGWTDYEVSIEAELFSGNGYGIYYRVTGEPDISGYCFQFIATGTPKFLIRPVIDGRERLAIYKVLTEEVFSGFGIYDQSHEVVISIQGDHHIIKIDGEPVADFYDDTFQSGMVGLRTWATSEVEFGNLNLTAID